MKSNSIPSRQSISLCEGACPSCEDEHVSFTMVDYDYVYGTGESALRILVTIPVYTCAKCKFQFTNWQTEEIEHRALCKHFGTLNRTEINQLRNRHGMSRKVFAKLTGVGETSLTRWEKGLNIQSLANDRYLRLLEDFNVIRQLQDTVSEIESREQFVAENLNSFPNVENQSDLKQVQFEFELRGSF